MQRKHALSNRFSGSFRVVTALLALFLLLPVAVLATPPIGTGMTIEFAAGGSDVGTTGTNGINAVAIGDLDGDGKLDLVTGDAGGDVIVWQNSGTPFSSTWSISNTVGTSTSAVYGVAVGDLDGDGDLDIVSVSDGSGEDNEVIAWENSDTTPFSGSWTQRDVGTVDGTTDALAVAIGDLDRDGHLDVVTGDSSHDVIAWESGGGAFPITWTRRNIGTDVRTIRALTIGDLDGDGQPDVVSGQTNGTGDEITAWQNDGTPFDGVAWSSQGVGNGVGSINALTLGDLDKDGDLDIASGDVGNAVRVFENDGSPFVGVWSLTTAGASGDDVNAVALADLDDDGDPDIVTGSSATEDYEVIAWQNDGTPFSGTWSQRDVGASADAVNALAVADLDGDGDVDVVTGSGATEDNEVIAWQDALPHRNVSWSADSNDFGPSSDRTDAMVLGDVDGDGDLDIAVGNYGQQNVVYYNNGSGTFITSAWFGTGTDDTLSLALGDVDSDGDLDLAVGNYFGQIVVYFNDGDGTFDTSSTNVGDGSDYTYAPVFGDVDGDGDPDLAAGNRSQQNVVYLNNGDGTFAATGNNFGTGNDATYALAIGDVDRDGDLDLAVGNNGAQNVVYLNNGDGTFATTGNSFGPTDDHTRSLTLVDVDRDGDLDLATGNSNQQNVIYLNDGDGTFDTTSTNLGTVYEETRALPPGDVDGDGDPDLGLSNDNFQNKVYLNDGDGTFDTTTLNFGSGNDATRALAFGDMDGDGDLDVAVGNYEGQNAVYLNEGGRAYFDVTDTAPGNIADNTEDDVLQVIFVHNGITGDRDLEMFSFGLEILQSDCATAYTTAQAAAIIDDIYVRLDDGDHIFEGTDTAVATVDTLSLNSGVQTVPFTNNDTNVQVSVGGTYTRTYWVSVLTTADASSQNPNDFCIRVDPDANFLVEGKTPDFSVSQQDTGPTSTGGINNTPTAVKLAGFSATASGHSVQITWETVTEIDNLGFNLYRGTSPGGPFVQLNATLIPTQNPGQVLGATYTWLDDGVTGDGIYYYLLEDVSVNHIITTHGSVSATVRSPTNVSLTVTEARGNALSALSLAVVGGAAISLLRRRRKRVSV